MQKCISDILCWFLCISEMLWKLHNCSKLHNRDPMFWVRKINSSWNFRDTKNNDRYTDTKRKSTHTSTVQRSTTFWSKVQSNYVTTAALKFYFIRRIIPTTFRSEASSTACRVVKKRRPTPSSWSACSELWRSGEEEKRRRTLHMFVFVHSWLGE